MHRLARPDFSCRVLKAAIHSIAAILGLDKSRKEAAEMSREAMDALLPFGKKAQRLREIAEYLLKREY